MSKKQIVDELEIIILNDIDVDILNIKPEDEQTLYMYYANYVDIVVQYLKLTVSHMLHPITNETRAMLGHLSEYNETHTCDKNDLEKAYGHFRRLTLDAFKILCDEFDAAIFKSLTKQYHYDFRNINANYLKDFSKQYISAKKAYILAQQSERCGSDSNNKANIIKLYYSAAKKYIELRRFYLDNKKKTNGVKICSCALNLMTVFSLIASTVVSTLAIILK